MNFQKMAVKIIKLSVKLFQGHAHTDYFNYTRKQRGGGGGGGGDLPNKSTDLIKSCLDKTKSSGKIVFDVSTPIYVLNY